MLTLSRPFFIFVPAALLCACMWPGTDSRDSGNAFHRVVLRNGNDTNHIVLVVTDDEYLVKGGESRPLYRDTLAAGVSSDTLSFPTDSLYGISWSWSQPVKVPDLPTPQNSFSANKIFRAYHSWDSSFVGITIKLGNYVETPPIDFR